ncbi:NAD(P)-binding Rossmann-fold superfamily protein isoform X2 [Tasmannia lanceolata]|uniref:NAD(P)-binding Rossmann-fold superfamily protein isoform X2 n=1 Tax=Tasmannia lanceolata TaxID=3420 RepID=UPI004062FD60
MEICHISGPLHLLSVGTLPQTSTFRKCKKSNPFYSLQLESKIQRSETLPHIFIFGIGFVGQYFANQLKNDCWKVSGTCTSVIKKENLEKMGFEAFLFSASDLELRSLNALQDASHLLISIPPIVDLGDPVLCLHQDILRNKLSNGNLQWLCYLSSTSVYGDCGGAWVNEDYPINAATKSAKARLAAEKGWLDLGHDLGVPAHVFRLGGIYGPGRSALDTIIKKESLSQDPRMRGSRHYTARVHVADICRALKASIDMTLSRKIYNVVDDDPAPRAEVFAFARDLIEKRWPGKMDGSHSPSTEDLTIQKNSNRGEKQVSNALLKKELGVSLLHPTYRCKLMAWYHLFMLMPKNGLISTDGFPQFFWVLIF